VILRAALLFSLLISIVGCRETADEPALGERAWGKSDDVAKPEDVVGGASRPPISDDTRPESARDGPPTVKPDATATDTADTAPRRELANVTADVVPDAGTLPLSRDGLLLLLRPEEAPDDDETRLLRTALDALGMAPASPQRDLLMRRLLIAWTARDASGATALALALPEAAREDSLQDLAPLLAPLLGADQLPSLLALADLPGPANRRLLGRCARDLVGTRPDAARACHAALGDRGDRVALTIARDLAAQDEAEARIWVAAIRDQGLRAEALAEIGAARGGGSLEGIDDDALKDWARARALVRLAEERPQAALLGVDGVADPARRAEVLEAAAWAWVRQGFPDLAREVLKDTAATTAQVPLRRAAERPAAVETPLRTSPERDDCEALRDPHLGGACMARRAEAAVAQGERDAARAALQAIPDDTWRAAALVPLIQGLDAADARAWLHRSQALRERLPDATRERHLLALLERCALPPRAHLRDGLALLQDGALRRGLLQDAATKLDAEGLSEILTGLTDPYERAILCVAALEQDSVTPAPPK
jgi:hypothetical protein